MALAIIYSRASSGISAPLVTVETHISFGMAGFHIVGLPEVAVKESRDRVRSALLNSHFDFPARRITVNLAPADLPKEGGRFDLPIALGILAASGQLPADPLLEYEFTGELALSGELRKVRGILPIALAAHQVSRKLIVPEQNAEEAALAHHAEVYAAGHLLEVCAHLQGSSLLPICTDKENIFFSKKVLDMADIKGQPLARRALEVAAAGRHSIIFSGPPGTGKTMLASRLAGISPELNDEQAMAVAAIASISSKGFDPADWRHIPFRSPHHSSSSTALVGGGRPPRPGEISLAHHGILFLDELPEFSRQSLECLREPLESGSITISRAAFQSHFPADFQLVAAMNPCPCGYAGSTVTDCQCSHEQIRRYLAKISGPMLDRIDMHVEVPRLSPELLIDEQHQVETSEIILRRVLQARELQHQRQGKCNAALTALDLENNTQLRTDSKHLLMQVMLKFNLSARACHRMIKVARTIADLEDSSLISPNHLSEVLNYRCFDKINGRFQH